MWRPHFQNPWNINNVENPQFNQDNRPSTIGGLASRGRGRGRGPPKIQNHDPKDPYFYCQYHGRGHNTEACPETKKNIARIQQEKTTMNIASTMSNQFRPSFWQPQFMSSQPNPVTVQQFQQPQPSWQPSQQFYPSLMQFNQFNNHSQFKKYCHHRPTIRQGQNWVQELTIRKLCLLSELSCPSQVWQNRSN
jgi:hypothetical protein